MPRTRITDEKTFFTVSELRSRWKPISKKTIYRMIKAGALAAHEIGGSLREKDYWPPMFLPTNEGLR